MLRESEKSLSIQYFSREFPAGLEVEWKTGLASCDPAGFIFKLDDCLLCGELFPFFKARTMGNQPIGISYLNIWCHYYGHLKQGKWVEDLVLVQPPATPIFIPRVKVDRAGDYNNLPENVLVREETKGTKFEILPERNIGSFLQKFEMAKGVALVKVGTIEREKWSFYLTNRLTGRNWNVLADLCHMMRLSCRVTNSRLSQVEVEYKGISGIALANRLSQHEVIQEMLTLGERIIDESCQTVFPSKITKFDWLVSQQ